MGLHPQKRKRSCDALRCHAEHRRRISDQAIVRGVEVEFDRTLPFWRCYTDFHLSTRRKPEVVVKRETQLLCRIPCRIFKRVDVVWARTSVQMRESAKHEPESTPKTRQQPKKKMDAGHKSSNPPSVSYIIDTMHFVHEDAYKKGPGSEHSFHVQSVVLRDAPAVLQCVAGSMVSFSFIAYTALRMIHHCETRGLHVSLFAKEVEQQVSEYHSMLHSSSEGIDTADSNAVLSSSSSSSLSDGRGNASPQGGHLNQSITLVPLDAFHRLRSWCPPATSRVLILGMGGNSMALALRAVLGPAAVIEVVELEPAVAAACLQVGTLAEDDGNMSVHLEDADTCLRTLPSGVYDFIYMDIFEPVEATMKNLHPWVAAAREKLTAGGLLVMNEHQLPSAEGLAPYARLFGNGNVQAVNLRGWNESVVACVAPGSRETDSYTLLFSKTYADVAFNVYEALVPGWLPHFSWLKMAKTHRFEKTCCRLWTS